MGRIGKRNLKLDGKKSMDIIKLSNNNRSGRRINYYDLTTQYIKWYNREVTEFFDRIPNMYPKLHSSYVHVNSSYEFHKHKSNQDSNVSDSEYNGIDESDEFGEVIEYGSYWSSSEKRMFFNCLSKYSIHRLDDWYPYFNGTKSKIEILTYYNVLQKNLKSVKERFPNLLYRYEDYPVSYEMDDNFIEFDEHMSQRLVDRDQLEYYYDNQPVNNINNTNTNTNTNLIVNFDKWSQIWNQFYQKSINNNTDVEADTKYPEFIGDEMNYKQDSTKCYEIQKEVIELRGKEHKILQYTPVDENETQNIMTRTTTTTARKPTTKSLPFNKESMEYMEKCVRRYIRDVLYCTILSRINKRSIHGDHVNKLFRYSNRVNFKKILNKRYKKDIKLSVKNKERDYIIKNERDTEEEETDKNGRMLYPHVITKEEIIKGIILMRQDKPKKHIEMNKSIEVINTINKFEMKLGDDKDDMIFKERWFLRSLMNEMIYDKLNHPIPIVINNINYNDMDIYDSIKNLNNKFKKGYDNENENENENDNYNIKLESEYSRLIKTPIDQELKMIIGLMKKGTLSTSKRINQSYKINSDKETRMVKNRFKFEIINDDNKYIEWGPMINEILNKRLDNELELKLIDKETRNLERKDQLRSRQYLDALYHYFGSILSMTPPGTNTNSHHYGDSNNILANRLYVMIDEDDIGRGDEEENGEDEDREEDYIWPSSVKVFERMNF